MCIRSHHSYCDFAGFVGYVSDLPRLLTARRLVGNAIASNSDKCNWTRSN